MSGSLRSVPRPLSGTPVLTYHGFDTGDESTTKRRERKYSIDPALFREQMQFLQGARLSSQTMPEFWGTQPGPRPSIVLSFDDGRASDYEIAFPILLETGMNATFFVNTATVGTAGFLSWGQIGEMQRYGMSFQSHGHEHLYLSRLARRDLQKQVQLSKQMIEEHTSAPVEFLAAPYGDTGRLLLDAVAKAGYSALCTSHNWPARPGQPTVHRIVVYGSSSIETFARLVGRDPYVYTGRLARQTCMSIAKELFFLCRNPARRQEVAEL